MRKNFLFTAVFSLLFTFMACSSDDSDSSGGNKAISRSAQTIDYVKGTNVYEINNDIGSLTLKGFEAKTKIFLAKTNPNPTLINMAETHYISGGENIELTKSEVQSRQAANSSDDTIDSGKSHSECYSMKLAAIAANQREAEKMTSQDRTAAASKKELTDKTLDESGNKKTFSLGTKKHFYLDTTFDASWTNLLWWSEGDATLEAIGYQDDGTTPVCYVWVLGEVTGYNPDKSVNFTEETSLTTEATAKKGKINRALAQAYADAFVKIYNLDTEIFGDVPTRAFCDGVNKSDIKYLSETGSVINLVFYDINHKMENAALCGFYYGSKDLFPNENNMKEISSLSNPYESNDSRRFSNEGNYLYINSYMSDKMGSMYITIVHEFQHMIHQNVKGGLDKDGETFPNLESTYNEMFAVAAEDLAFMFFPEINYNTEAPLKYIKNAEDDYIYNGIEENAARNYLYYGTGFSFISWIMRKYTAQAMQSIAKNEYLGWNAIINGINALQDDSGKNYSVTIESLLRDYSATKIRGMGGNPTKDGFIYTAREAGSDSTGCYCKEQDYGYPLISIKLKGTNNAYTMGFSEQSDSIWTQKFPNGVPNDFGEINLGGFQLYDSNVVASLRPYGMMLHEIGPVLETKDVKINFTSDSKPSEKEKLYLVIITK